VVVDLVLLAVEFVDLVMVTFVRFLRRILYLGTFVLDLNGVEDSVDWWGVDYLDYFSVLWF